jgi:hypothetical protein
LLCTRCERPSRSCAAKQRDEFASFHRITSRQARRSRIEAGAVGASDR